MKLCPYRLLYLPLVVFITACGGGGGGSTPATTVPPPVLSSGVFLDSLVEGVTYQSGSNPPGTTDVNGSFNYTPGEPLTFSIGGVVLGTLTDGAPIITPFDFGAAAENIARFLQTLDADGDPSNGIDLTAAAAMLADTVLDAAVFQSDAATFEAAIAAAVEVVLGAGEVLIDAATAIDNLFAGTATPEPTGPSTTVTSLDLGGVELDQTFDPTQTDYTAGVEFIVGFVHLTPSANPDAIVLVNGTVVDAAGIDVPLAPGSNTIQIMIIEDGFTPTLYTLTINRPLLPLLTWDQGNWDDVNWQ